MILTIIIVVLNRDDMPLILDRRNVLDVYAKAREQQWVLPAFNTENLTTTEAILTAVYDYGKSIGIPDLPIIIGITNQYKDRPQAVVYSQTRNWEVGLRLFLADIDVLTSPESPFSDLQVLIHLDHIVWDVDRDLLKWDMGRFSSIMYDASTLPFDENIGHTAEFVEKHGQNIVIEGACDAIAKATESDIEKLTTPEMAERYMKETGVDLIVPNLGTEHRAATSTLKYHDDLARKIAERTGPHLCLHGTSSVSKAKVRHLYEDGICKVNVWTALERDSSMELFKTLVQNAAKIIGPKRAAKLLQDEFLGKQADTKSQPSLDYYTTTYRQDIIFRRMCEIVTEYLKIWYV